MKTALHVDKQYATKGLVCIFCLFWVKNLHPKGNAHPHPMNQDIKISFINFTKTSEMFSIDLPIANACCKTTTTQTSTTSRPILQLCAWILFPADYVLYKYERTTEQINCSYYCVLSICHFYLHWMILRNNRLTTDMLLKKCCFSNFKFKPTSDYQCWSGLGAFSRSGIKVFWSRCTRVSIKDI